jgi:lysine 2,3-aminomutase
LAGGECAAYCRYCFRRVWLAAAPGFIAGRDLEQALAYLAAHPEIHEILVSGGDPLTADNIHLEELFCLLRQARPGSLLRICTRIPITNPSRFDDETIALFRRFRPLRLSLHINHPRELTTLARERLTACVDAGIPAHVQTVLLRDVNDNAALLAELFRECLTLGLTPYYLFQLDLAPGTAHFRVPLRRGLELYRELTALISGLGLPAYAVDLPGGGGKIRLHEGVIAGEKETPAGRVYLLRDSNGHLWEYPY